MSEHAFRSRRVTTTSDSSARCASSSKKGLRALRFARRRGEEERADMFRRPRATTNKAATWRETQRAERAIRRVIARPTIGGAMSERVARACSL
jgi:hypothetical protein